MIYKGNCSCGSLYIGETKCNVEFGWNEHNNVKLKLPRGPLKHFRNNTNCFTRAIILSASRKDKTEKT